MGTNFDDTPLTRMRFCFDPTYRSRLLGLPQLLARGGATESGAAGRLRGGRVEFHEHRAYVPGDDPRDLDWNLFLRLDQLAVKEYARDEAPEVLVILDRSASMGTPGSGKDRIVREVAGGLIWTALRKGAPASLLVLSSKGPVTLARYQSHRMLDRVLAQLEDLEDPAGPTHLSTLVRLGPSPASGRLAFLLSDFLVDPLPSAGILALATGDASGSLLQVMAEEERHPRLPVSTTLSDPETGARLPVPDAPALLVDYAEELARHEADVARLARTHTLRHVMVHDRVAFETGILAALRAARP